MNPVVLRWLLLSALILPSCKPSPHSDPTAPRNPSTYQTILNPTSTASGPPGNVFETVAITNTGSAVEIHLGTPKGYHERADGQTHQVHRSSPGAVIEGTHATFRLLSYGVGYPLHPRTNYSNYIPLTHFSPDGRALTPAEMKSLGLQSWHTNHSSSRAYFPVLQLILGETNRPPANVKLAGIFDARTKASLSSGYSSRQVSRRSPGDISIEVQAWHAPPLEVVLDVELDGEHKQEIGIKPGTRHAVPGGMVLFAGLWEGDANSTSDSGGAEATLIRVGLSAAGERPRCSALFVTDPAELAVHFKLIGESGKALEGGGGMRSGRLHAIGVNTNIEAVKRIQMTVFTNHHLAVLTIPPLTGLPPANQSVRDLFDVVIPRAEIRDQYEFSQLLGRTIQMQFHASSLSPFPAGYFPRTYTNVTPANLLAEYRRTLPWGYTIVIDSQKQEIRVEQAKWLKPWLAVKKWLRIK